MRLGSGLVLFVYVGAHLVTHALGIWSLELAESGLTVAKAVWQSRPGTVALYGAASIHIGLALHTVHERRHWRLPPVEIVRLWAGFSLPLLLIGHAINTRLGLALFGLQPSYGGVIANLIASGSEGWQLALLAPGWLHGCLGLWLSMRRIELVRRSRLLLISVTATMPLLAAAGFVHMRAEVAANESIRHAAAQANASARSLANWRYGLVALYLVLLAGAFASGRLRNRIEARRAAAPSSP
jgi:adenylate cyclase